MQRYVLLSIITIVLLFILSPRTLGITLEEAIKEALEKNPQYVAEKAGILEAQADVAISKAFPNPSVDYEGSDIFKNPTSANRFAPTQLIIAQQFPIWGKRGLGIDASQFNLRSKEQDVLATKLLLIQTVKDVFYTALAQEQFVDIAKSNYELSEGILKAATRLYEEGETTLGDKLRAESELAEAKKEVIDSEKNLNHAKAELNFVLGRSANTPVSVEGDLPFIDVKENVDSLIDKAMSKRPELSRDTLTLNSLQKELSLARRSYFPDPEIGFITESGDETSYGLTFGISLPLWYQGQGEIAKAKARITRQESTIMLQRNQISLEVKNAYSDLEGFKDQIVLFQKDLIPNAEKAFDITNKAYTLGAEMIINLFEARRTLINARKGYVQALLDYNVSLAELEKALGEEIVRE